MFSNELQCKKHPFKPRLYASVLQACEYWWLMQDGCCSAVMVSELENIHSLKEEQKASFLLQVTELSFPRPRTGGSIIGISCLITQGEKKYCFQTIWIKFYDHQTQND